MKASALSEDIIARINHIENWSSVMSDEVANILVKIASGTELSRAEMVLDISHIEVAAIWSVKYHTPINPAYVREVRRKGRLKESRALGSKEGSRYLYKVRDVLPIVVGRKRGRPPKEHSATPIPTPPPQPT